MLRLTILAVSSVLALSTVPVKAQPVPVVPVVPAPVIMTTIGARMSASGLIIMNSSTASGRKNAISTPAAGPCMSNVDVRRKTASTAAKRARRTREV